MKNLGTLIRLHKWQLNEKRRKLGELEGLRNELCAKLEALDRQLGEEQSYAGSHQDVAFAYAGFSGAVRQKRETIEHSIADVEREIVTATTEVRLAFQELKRYEIAEAARQTRAKRERDRRETLELDEIATNHYIRRKSA